MFYIRITAALVLAFIFFVSSSHAVEIMGSATVNASEFGPNPYETNKKKIKAKAVEAACFNALDKYTVDFATARLSIYERIEKQVKENLDDYLICGSVIDESFDIGSNELSVVIKVKVKVNKFENAMEEASSSSSQGDEDTEPELILLSIFSRQVDKVKQKDAKVVKINQRKTSVDEDQTEMDTDTDYSVSSSSTETDITTSGGSTENSSETVQYKVSNDHSTIIISAVSSVFTTAGYEMLSLEDYTSDMPSQEELAEDDPTILDKMMSSLASKGKVSARLNTQIRKWTFDDANEEPAMHIIEGIINIGRQEKDASGNDSVTVTVAKLQFKSYKKFKGPAARKFDAEDRSTWSKKPRGKGTVASVMAKGSGTNPSAAITNAINNAAKKAAKELLDDLRKKGI